MYLFGIKPIQLNCFGGGSQPAPAPVAEPTPPPQLAKPPQEPAIRRRAATGAGGNGAAATGDAAMMPGSVTLLGDPTSVDDKLGKKTLLGK